MFLDEAFRLKRSNPTTNHTSRDLDSLVDFRSSKLRSAHRPMRPWIAIHALLEDTTEIGRICKTTSLGDPLEIGV